MEITDEMSAWMDRHRDYDPMRLRMRYHGTPEAGKVNFMILQMECRRKVARKLPAFVANPRLVFPTALSSEQCTSELLAAEHAALISPGSRVLDMTCGLGIDAMALARIAASVVAVERDRVVVEAVRQNVAALGLHNLTVVNGSCENYIRDCDSAFDCVFIDPARRGTEGQRLFALSDCSPDVTALLPEIQARASRLIIKSSPMLDIKRVLSEFPHVTALYIYGTKKECKELVVDVDFNRPEDDAITLHAVTVGDGFRNEVIFSGVDDAPTASYDMPRPGDILYEPYPSVMKSGCFNLLAQEYGVAKLHHDTHLYLSPGSNQDFPGDRFMIEEIMPFSSRLIKGFSRRYEKINVATRNFRMRPEELKKRLGVKDGGDRMLFGVTLADGSAALLIVKRIFA